MAVLTIGTDGSFSAPGRVPRGVRLPGSSAGGGGHEPPPQVLFVTDLWGYGTTTMAMTVAEEMDGRAVRLFAGMGPGFELARRSSFDRLLAVDTMAEPVAQSTSAACPAPCWSRTP